MLIFMQFVLMLIWKLAVKWVCNILRLPGPIHPGILCIIRLHVCKRRHSFVFSFGPVSHTYIHLSTSLSTLVRSERNSHLSTAAAGRVLTGRGSGVRGQSRGAISVEFRILNGVGSAADKNWLRAWCVYMCLF